MGVSCKPVGKFQGVMRRVTNELEKQKKLEKKSKSKEVSK
jgi:hypothetical protein